MLAEGNGLTANGREWTRIRRKIHHRDTEYTEVFGTFVEKSYSVASVSLWCKFGFHSRKFASIRGLLFVLASIRGYKGCVDGWHAGC